ncbi:MAG: hypothetical protein ACI8VC_002616 [Candidatus Endobugula sp.]|jgi:hypothetical protein
MSKLITFLSFCLIAGSSWAEWNKESDPQSNLTTPPTIFSVYDNNLFAHSAGMCGYINMFRVLYLNLADKCPTFENFMKTFYGTFDPEKSSKNDYSLYSQQLGLVLGYYGITNHQFNVGRQNSLVGDHFQKKEWGSKPAVASLRKVLATFTAVTLTLRFKHDKEVLHDIAINKLNVGDATYYHLADSNAGVYEFSELKDINIMLDDFYMGEFDYIESYAGHSVAKGPTEHVGDSFYGMMYRITQIQEYQDFIRNGDGRFSEEMFLYKSNPGLYITAAANVVKLAPKALMNGAMTLRPDDARKAIKNMSKIALPVAAFLATQM